MGPAGRLGLCLVLSAVTPAALGAPCPNGTQCGCRPGYEPPLGLPEPFNPDSCDDINECLQQPLPCGPHQTCENIPGTFKCNCDPGYSHVPPTGTPPTGGTPTTGTPPTGTPTGSPPTRTPTAPPPLNCVDVDECTERGEGLCKGGSVCFNTPGSYECHCPPGYTGTPDIGCTDVDECTERGEGLCKGGSVCFNTPGSYECHCPPGYAGTPDIGCTAVTVPPLLCPEDQNDCGLDLPLLYGLLRGGGDPHDFLKHLLTILDGAFEAGGGAAPPQRHRRVTALLGGTEGLVRGVGALLRGATNISVTTAHSVLHLAVHQSRPPGPVRLRVPNVELDVPREVAWDGDTGRALVALLSHGGLSRVLEGAPKVKWGGWGELDPPPARSRPSYRLLSPVATAFVTRPRPPGSPEITLWFQHQPLTPQRGHQVLCAFWHPQEQLWATQGCRVVPPPSGTPLDPPSTTCACNHLTSFAVLLAFHEIEESSVLDLVTRVGLGVSVASLGVAVATFLFCRALKGLRTTLHLHLSLSLLLAHGTFLLGIDRTQPPAACAVVAGLLHFFFLAAFCWMCLEGLHLYVLLVRVFVPSWLRVRHLLLAGYGLPALLVAIAAAAFPRGYGTPRYCWLSLERGFRWSFQAPVCLIIAVNAVILVVTIWKLVQKFNDVNPDMGHLRKMRVLAATGAGQLCLLGSGWALGLGVGVGPPRPGEPPSPLAFLFCALNAAQGLFILLFHCLAHPQVRDAYRACLCPGAKRYSEFTSATSNTSNTRVSRQQTYT